MIRLKLSLIFLLVFPSIHNLSAQENNDKSSLDKGTVENQFNYVLEKSSRYEDYKVVKEGWLYVLKAHVLDSVKSLKKGLKESNITIQSKNSEIDSLHNEMKALNEKLDYAVKNKDSLGFLGGQMSKTAYNSLMWTIVLVLAGGLGVFVMMYKRCQSVTSQTKQDLNELKEEFDTFRKRALEREEKLSRRYLDELNKYKSKQIL